MIHLKQRKALKKTFVDFPHLLWYVCVDENQNHHTFATKLFNGTKCADGSIKTLNIKAVADILGHTTTEIIERYYVKKDASRLSGIIFSRKYSARIKKYSCRIVLYRRN